MSFRVRFHDSLPARTVHYGASAALSRVWQLLAACLLLVPAGFAADTPVAISDVRIGFAGAVKVGRWIPITFHLSGPAGATIDASVAAPDPDGSETAWKLPATTLDASGSGTVSGLFKIGRLDGTIRLTAGSARFTIPAGPAPPAGAVACVPQSQHVPLIVVLGTAPGFAAAPNDADNQRRMATGAPPLKVAEFPAATDLPIQSDAYDAADVVVLSQQFDLSVEQSVALADWVRQGGHVIVALGGDPRPFAESPIASWAPIRASGGERFRELAALVERVPGAPPIIATGGLAGVRIEAPGGVVLAKSLNAPLATRSPYGLGRVTALAVAWSDQRLQTWPGLHGLCRYLADLDRFAANSGGDTRTQLRPTGVSDLATQLASQLDHFRSVRRPSYWTVISFAAAFMLLIGPLDYLLVHRVLKQPRLTWFTFPAWIVFAAVAASMGADRLNSAERQANQFDLVDVDAATGVRRAQSWMTLYSPASRRLRVESSTADWLTASHSAPMRLSWSGIPESGFGGMYRSGGLNLANPPYTIAVGGAAAENVPIGQWSSKALAADWQMTNSGGEPLVTSELADDGTGYLEGTLTHRLPNGITDWCVAYGSLAYFPRESQRVDRVDAIAPGVPWSPADSGTRRLLVSYLQGLTQTYQSDSASSTRSSTSITKTAYDPLGLDPFPLARMLTFYEVADGLNYTSLANSSLGRSDLSRVLALKRAVVFGRIASPAAEYAVDGAAVTPQERWTFVRLVLPVKPGVAPSLRDTGGLRIR